MEGKVSQESNIRNAIPWRITKLLTKKENVGECQLQKKSMPDESNLVICQPNHILIFYLLKSAKYICILWFVMVAKEYSRGFLKKRSQIKFPIISRTCRCLKVLYQNVGELIISFWIVNFSFVYRTGGFNFMLKLSENTGSIFRR